MRRNYRKLSPTLVRKSKNPPHGSIKSAIRKVFLCAFAQFERINMPAKKGNYLTADPEINSWC